MSNQRDPAGGFDGDIGALPLAGFAFPGPLRDRLVAAILAGTKTSTTALMADYAVAGDPLPRPGDLAALVDSADRAVAVLETVAVAVVALREVELAHAVDEGEGFATVDEWRAAHEVFWHGAQMRAFLGDPDFHVTDETAVVLERFRVLRRSSATSDHP